MLVFLFSCLIVVLDQFIKRWIVRVLPLRDSMELIPGVIELTHVQNTGAAFGLLAGQRWLLAGIAFVACIIIIFILLRYTDGFWGALGFGAVLGGAVGNLIDRVFLGHVIDMFRPMFINFAVFNVADIFITLGFLTFCIHFISSSVRESREDKRALEDAKVTFDELDYDDQEYDDQDYDDLDYDEQDVSYEEEYPDPYREFELPLGEQEREIRAVAPVDMDAEPDLGYLRDYISEVHEQQASASPAASGVSAPAEKPAEPRTWQEYYEPVQKEANTEAQTETPGALNTAELKLNSIDDYNVDALLREYGFEDDKSK